MGKNIPNESVVMIEYIVEKSSLPRRLNEKYSQLPTRFTLGYNEIVPELDIGIQTMKLKESARFVVYPKIASKLSNKPSTTDLCKKIQYKINLVTFYSPTCKSSYFVDDPSLFKKTIIQAKQNRTEGEEQLKLKNYERAIVKFIYAKELLISSNFNCGEKETEDMEHILNKLFENLSKCYLNRCAFDKVSQTCKDALKFCEIFSKNNAKLFYTWSQALRMVKHFTEADEKLHIALCIKRHSLKLYNERNKLKEDRVFQIRIEKYTLKNDDDDDYYNGDECLPLQYWELFNSRLSEFVSSNDNIFTITLGKNAEDIEIAKRKATKYRLQFCIIKKAGVKTDIVAISKSVQ